MLDSETKRRIDTARNILVGKLPNPMSQVEQITIALVYKFMDDMDAETEEMGGERTFFSGEFARYSWANLMDVSLGGNEMLNRYAEGIERMNQNPGIPSLFRDIFRNAFLPYRDPETLKLFLKTIDGFNYDHSENLGDAFEYLLSILGSQGDAGQFRTPRHIIDFMVQLVDPKKEESVLDPACGTAGFLISAYRYIMTEERRQKAQGQGMRPEERTRLMENFEGYDISPEMVRISRVNMYLHGFQTPKIHEYDTLTSDERWNDFADVILANPPFMSPQGGIKPHKRFSVESSRSEVLFVDYIMEHLTPNGRAAVIVPEGIIFQSGKAYKALRKKLVDEDYLVGVISLPAGVFNPYSGVKTSILWIDRALAKKAKEIPFCKIEHDGYDLGAQRKPNGKDDLPIASQLLNDLKINHKEMDKHNNFPLDFKFVSKNQIAATGNYQLGSDRYLEKPFLELKYPTVKLGEICEIRKGKSITSRDITPGPYPVIAGGQSPAYFHNEFNYSGVTVTVSASGAYAGFVNYFDTPIFASDCSVIRVIDNTKVNSKFIYLMMKYKQNEIYKYQLGMGQPHVYPRDLVNFEIPLPTLNEQKAIIDEIESYQKIIDGARMVVENYRPRIDVDPSWPVVKLGEVCEINKESGNPKDLFTESFTYIDISSVENGTGKVDFRNIVSIGDAPSRARRIIRKGDILLSTVRPNLKAFAFLTELPENALASTGFAVLTCNKDLDPKYIYYMLFSDLLIEQMISRMGKGSYPSINQNDVNELKIPLPTLAAQKVIVQSLELESRIVEANKDLISLYEEKNRAKIAKVWGE